ncbi:sensor histidine kinase [Miltoncostaea oceani]|uniref:sensor histidine kinase n=1 Tax=Miltoncostaea oceani TaxID=2843216 RepID=UPI001C3DD06E|nr:HAMP domain-containing sensor histidine kinase [Miltoncostaea oceani]
MIGTTTSPGAVAPADHLARVVHDLHGPLTVIRGMCATLLRDEPARDRRRALALIDAEVLRVADGLRDLSRTPVGDPPAPGCDLAEVVRAAVRRFGPVAESGGRRVVARGRRGPLPVAAPPAALARVLDNLLWNALRHAADGGVVVVGARVRRGVAEVHVRDDGPGVPAGDRERIFLPGDRGSAPRGAGHGLGLAIAREIAEAHGGRLTLDAVGSGACFRLALPLRSDADPGPRAA